MSNAAQTPGLEGKSSVAGQVAVAPPPPVPRPMPVGEPTADAAPAVIVQPSFWQHPFVQNVLPFLTSLTLHVGIVLFGLLTLKAVEVVTQVVQVQEQIIVPESAIIDGAPIGGVLNPGLGGDPNRRAEQDKYPEIVNSDGWAETKTDRLTAGLLGGGGGNSDDSGIIGLGSGSGFGSGGGLGTGRGVGVGSGTGEPGGPLAPYGVPGGGAGLQPRTTFVGVSGNARRIVFLCDATGSMMTCFDQLRVELRRAVDGLKPIQSFNVIFFSDTEVFAINQRELIPATTENKRRTYDFVNEVTARGQTNPFKAIEMAFAQQPQLLYVLTDGFDQVSDYEEVVEKFRKLNPDKRVKVNTLLIPSSDDPELVRVMEQIAAEHGGVFKIVNFDRW